MRGIAVLVAMSIMLMVLISCQLLGGGGGGILPPIGGGSGGGMVRGSGNIANNFGSSLGRDIDGDGDIDSAVLMNQIHNDIREGSSIFVTNTGVYVAGYGGFVWGYVLKLDYNGNVVNNFGGTIGNGAPSVQGMVTFRNIVGGNYGEDAAEDVYVSGGSVYVVGYSAYNDGTSGGIVIKMDKNSGTLDSNFGTNGVKVINDVDGQDVNDGCTAVYVEGNNLYVAIFSGPYLYVKKLDAGNGSEIVSSQRLERSSYPDCDIESSGDGNIIVGISGYNDSTDYIYITKLDGSSLVKLYEKKIMPSDFSNFGSYDYLYYRDHYVSGGNVYVVGTLRNVNDFNNWPDYDVAVMKLNSSDLSYDNNFGVGGKLVFNNIDSNSDLSFDDGHSIWVDSQGRIYVVGGAYDKIFVLRLNSMGNMDSSFGFGGKLVLDTMTSDPSEIDLIYSIFMYGASLYMTGRYTGGGLALRMDNLQ